jgi:catalase
LYTPVKLHGACTQAARASAYHRLPNVDQSAAGVLANLSTSSAPSVHILTFLLDDIGIPKDYRHMDGFGVHTFKFTRVAEKYVKFHWLTDQV